MIRKVSVGFISRHTQRSATHSRLLCLQHQNQPKENKLHFTLIPANPLYMFAEHLRGWRVKTSPVPPKAPFFSALKSTNYLPNALALMDAEAEGYHQGIFVDANGHVAEGPNANVGVITQEGVLVVPPFDSALPGITMRRLLELARDAIARKVLDGVTRIERRHFTVEEAKACREVFLVGSGAVVMPVVTWDDVAIGDGVAGMGALQLRALMQGDMRPGSNGDHTQVPYGVMTGMGA
jgi:4-amino-4-deoxychorismate lyase